MQKALKGFAVFGHTIYYFGIDSAAIIVLTKVFMHGNISSSVLAGDGSPLLPIPVILSAFAGGSPLLKLGWRVIWLHIGLGHGIDRASLFSSGYSDVHFDNMSGR